MHPNLNHIYQNLPMYTKDSNDRFFFFGFPFLAGALLGGAAVGFSRPRPIVAYPPYYAPYPVYPYPPYPYPPRVSYNQSYYNY